MKSRCLLVTGAISVLILSLNVNGQDSGKAVTVAANGQFSVAFKAQRIPGDAFVSISGMAGVDSNGIHRVWADKTRAVYFGYDVMIEPLSDQKQFRVSVNELNKDYAKGLEADGRLRPLAERQSGNLASGTFQFPEPRIINDGDSIGLDVFINRQTGVKLIDIITVSSKHFADYQVPATGQPKDFSLSDIQMTMRDHRLLVNGELVAGDTDDAGSCSGEFLFFYLRGRGRFIFSLTPHDEYDFQKIGVIENNRISFSLGGVAYEWVSSTSIVGKAGNWNLWVRHEPEYLPSLGSRNSRFFLGAMGNIRGLSHQYR